MRNHVHLASWLAAVVFAAGCSESPPPGAGLGVRTGSQLASVVNSTPTVSLGVIQVAPTIPATGPFTVTVTDTDPNVDSANPDAVFVYASTSEAGPWRRAALEETGASTGVFVGGVDLVRADGQTVYLTYRDQATSKDTCGPGIVPASTLVDADAQFLPDLVPENIVPSSTTVVAGGRISVTAAVRNVGNGVAAPSRVQVLLGRTVRDWQDGGYMFEASLVLNPVPTETDDVNSLTPGEVDSFEFEGVVPPGLNGAYAIRVIADVGSAVVESSEYNNVADVGVAVVGPDLAPMGPIVAPSSAVVGQTITVSGSILNQALVEGDPLPAAGASNVQVLLGRTVRDWQEGGYIWETYLTLTRTDRSTNVIDALAAGKAESFTFEGVVPPLAAGGYTIRVVADAGQQIVERDEVNNIVDLGVAVGTGG